MFRLLYFFLMGVILKKFEIFYSRTIFFYMIHIDASKLIMRTPKRQTGTMFVKEAERFLRKIQLKIPWGIYPKCLTLPYVPLIQFKYLTLRTLNFLIFKKQDIISTMLGPIKHLGTIPHEKFYKTPILLLK